MSFFPEDRAAEMRQLFFESAQELLQSLNEEALKLEKEPGNAAIVLAIRRTVHTLKGDSAACGFREFSELAHDLEDALSPEVAAAAPAEIAELVLSAADVFDAMLAAYKNNLQPPDAQPLRRMMRNLGTLRSAPAKPAPAQPVRAIWSEYAHAAASEAIRKGNKVFHVVSRIDPQCPMRAAARQLIHNVLLQLGEVLAIHPEHHIGDELSMVEAIISTRHGEELITRKCRIPAVTTEVELKLWQAIPSSIPAAPAPKIPGPPASSSTPISQASLASAAENMLRVDAERIDHVLNLIGELIIGKSMLQQTLAAFSRRFPKDALQKKFAEAMAYQTRVLNDLQRSAMQVRMVPVEHLFRRFPRLVRDVAKLCNKDVAVMMSGQDTELDKSILDAIAEPLVHLVRNAVDHGIEAADERQRAGKPAKGTVRLNAYHQGNQVVIEISDDGRGIDPQKVLRTAVDRKIVTPEEAARLTPEEIPQLIFRPGFSTADHITEISGRGIGMDIVQTVLHRLKGTVTIDSKPGEGARFLLKVPLTLAIIKALLFRVEERLYAIPLNTVVEIARAPESELHRVENHEVLQLRNSVLTVVRLGRPPAGGSEIPRKLFIVVTMLGERKYGLIVDNLVGEEELVIKPLEDQMVATDLVSGASILGDGTVVLILNLAAIVERYAKHPDWSGLVAHGAWKENTSSAGTGGVQ